VRSGANIVPMRVPRLRASPGHGGAGSFLRILSLTDPLRGARTGAAAFHLTGIKRHNLSFYPVHRAFRASSFTLL